jgi:small subunit ribosomal protein S17
MRNKRKVRTGTVTSAGMDKTIAVAIKRILRHPQYGKIITKTSKVYAHDEQNQAGVGDMVTVMETRPLSRMKRWRLVKILEKAQ